MASGPTSWQIEEENVEAVTDFIFFGSKITVDGDCSHEIKRLLLLGRKAMTNLAAAAKSLQSCPTLCDPIDRAHQASLFLGFSMQEYWSGLPFPSPMHACMHAKSLQSCPTLCNPMDSSPSVSSVHRIL